MRYRYRAVERFWTSFYRLAPAQKESARRAWIIFKEDPFDPRLRTHKIQRLSAQYRRTIGFNLVSDRRGSELSDWR